MQIFYQVWRETSQQYRIYRYWILPLHTLGIHETSNQATSKLQHPVIFFRLSRFSHEGRGIAHYGSHPDHPSDKQGKKVFIRYALPGGNGTSAALPMRSKRLEEADSCRASE